jgi:hypothetical protein
MGNKKKNEVKKKNVNEKIDREEINIEEINGEKINDEEIKSEEIKSEKINGKEIKSEKIKSEKINGKEIDGEERNNEQIQKENREDKVYENEVAEKNELGSLPSAERGNFTRICNKLLSVGFLCKKKQGSRKDYFFVQKHREVFKNYLSVLGYDLEIHEEYGVVQLVNRLNYNHYRLKLYDTIILLLLRILYDEKKRELSLADDVIITVGEIQERYQALKIRSGMIDKTTMTNALMLFKRFQLLDTLDRDLTQEDARVLLLDSLLLAVRVEDVKEAFEKLQVYKRGEEE